MTRHAAPLDSRFPFDTDDMRRHLSALTRRDFLRGGIRGAIAGASLFAAPAWLLGACAPQRAGDASDVGASDDARARAAGDGRLLSRPRAHTLAAAPEAGLHPLGLSTGRDGLIYVPAGARADEALTLVMMLHGATGSARGALRPLMELADAERLLLLAPESRGQTWDAIRSSFGPDVAFVDRALAWTFARYAVRPDTLTIEGFSDGATYALSLGLTNGDLFGRIVACSPGFVASGESHGKPRVFISHGTRDEILPIDSTSRVIVPNLKSLGYDVTYREFDGPHAVPPEVARAIVSWLRG